MYRFSDVQNTALEQPLKREHVSQRIGAGNFTLSYVEGHYVIRKANEIFGFDGWSRETVRMRLVSEQYKGERHGVTYFAMVRIRVGDIVREGCGTGHGIDRSLGQAHEGALKEAETDAMKRALMTFGDQFGLALYDKEQKHVDG